MAQPDYDLSRFTLVVCDQDLSPIDMSEEEQDSLTADEIRSKGLRVCYVVDSDDFITDKDQEELKHLAQSRWTGIVFMKNLDKKYLGSNVHPVVGFFYDSKGTKPKFGHPVR